MDLSIVNNTVSKFEFFGRFVFFLRLKYKGFELFFCKPVNIIMFYIKIQVPFLNFL
jgi:hypothetical protein